MDEQRRLLRATLLSWLTVVRMKPEPVYLTDKLLAIIRASPQEAWQSIARDDNETMELRLVCLGYLLGYVKK
jgi:hypothetical protein